MGKMYNKYRLEELPIVADLLLQLMNRDLHHFASFSAEFNEDYLKRVREEVSKTQRLTSVQTITAEKSKLTSVRYAVMIKISYLLDRVDAYATRAADQLQVLPADFGVREAKQELKRKNVEGSWMRIKEVEKNIATNLVALQAKGYPAELGLELHELTGKMTRMNLQKVEMISRRKQLVIQNHIQYQRLWQYILEISDIGKLVMRPERGKASEYQLCNLLKHIRKPVLVEGSSSIPE
ncbi:hypothetical protein [Labilibaculum filiforme]|nr:hypothetical protein [Labilibaculum filiforme]